MGGESKRLEQILEFVKPLLEAEDLFRAKQELNSANIKHFALRAGMSEKDADKLESRFMLQEMPNGPRN